MKKIFAGLVLALVLAGCSSGAPAPTETSAAVPATQTQVAADEGKDVTKAVQRPPG